MNDIETIENALRRRGQFEKRNAVGRHAQPEDFSGGVLRALRKAQLSKMHAETATSASKNSPSEPEVEKLLAEISSEVAGSEKKQGKRIIVRLAALKGKRYREEVRKYLQLRRRIENRKKKRLITPERAESVLFEARSRLTNFLAKQTSP